MRTSIPRRTIALASGLVVAAVLGGEGGVAASPGMIRPGDGAVRATGMGCGRALGMAEVVDVSKDGRRVLGLLNGRYVVRDVVTNKTLRKLPTSPAYEYFGISDNGRYVSYTYTNPSGAGGSTPPSVSVTA